MPNAMGGELAGALVQAVGGNVRVNDVLCAQLTPEMMGALTPGGGMTVAQHLAHLAGVTREWLSHLDEGAAEPLPILYDDTREDPARAVWGRALEAALDAEGTGQLPHPSDAHHRGQVLFALKVNSFPLSDEDAMWGSPRGE